MAFSTDSKVGELLADEAAKAVLEKHIPGIASHPQIGQATAFSFKQVASYSQGQITDDMVKAIDEDLSKL